MNPRWILLTILVAGLPACASGSQRLHSFEGTQSPEYTFGFWNLENLFDTVDDPRNPGDDEYLPARGWDPPRYGRKLDHLAEVIAELDADILGVCEVENRRVLEDLIQDPRLRGRGYRIAHRDTPDKRGIDLALLYRAPFELDTGERAVLLHPIDLGEGVPPTRGILEVNLRAGEALLTVLVHHWPSRFGGMERSIPHRRAAAEVARRIVIARIDAAALAGDQADILLVGDLNDDPFDESVRDHLGAVRSRNAVINDRTRGRYRLYNPSWSFLGTTDLGTLYYNRGWTWNVFDQAIVSRGLLDSSRFEYVEGSLQVHGPDRMRDEFRRPRWFRKKRGSDEWYEGYSDHLPIVGRLRVHPPPPVEER